VFLKTKLQFGSEIVLVFMLKVQKGKEKRHVFPASRSRAAGCVGRGDPAGLSFCRRGPALREGVQNASPPSAPFSRHWSLCGGSQAWLKIQHCWQTGSLAVVRQAAGRRAWALRHVPDRHGDLCAAGASSRTAQRGILAPV